VVVRQLQEKQFMSFVPGLGGLKREITDPWGLAELLAGSRSPKGLSEN